MEYPSKLIEEAVNEISKLPGIGKKTAIRLALHLLKQPKDDTHLLSESLKKLREDTRYCSTCHIISDTEDCTCRTMRKDLSVICVVEDTPDVMAIQNTGQYSGLYHVLGGIISPMDGVGPEDVHIDSLIKRIAESDGEVKEVILALSTTMEGDTTAFYIIKKLQPYNIKITSIARGIPIGGELEYTDELTLGRSIITRTVYEQNA
ncbi:MAG: recombination mediator RecR [Cyclobacteriaceae bacterium]